MQKVHILAFRLTRGSTLSLPAVSLSCSVGRRTSYLQAPVWLYSWQLLTLERRQCTDAPTGLSGGEIRTFRARDGVSRTRGGVTGEGI